MQVCLKFLSFEKFVANHPVTPETLRQTIETKLDSVAYKPLLASAGGVERAAKGKYNIVLDDALSEEERRDIFLHELTHIHYADATPTTESKEDYDSCEKIVKQALHQFTDEHLEYANGLAIRHLL